MVLHGGAGRFTSDSLILASGKPAMNRKIVWEGGSFHIVVAVGRQLSERVSKLHSFQAAFCFNNSASCIHFVVPGIS